MQLDNRLGNSNYRFIRNNSDIVDKCVALQKLVIQGYALWDDGNRIIAIKAKDKRIRVVQDGTIIADCFANVGQNVILEDNKYVTKITMTGNSKAPASRLYIDSMNNIINSNEENRASILENSKWIVYTDREFIRAYNKITKSKFVFANEFPYDVYYIENGKVMSEHMYIDVENKIALQAHSVLKASTVDSERVYLLGFTKDGNRELVYKDDIYSVYNTVDYEWHIAGTEETKKCMKVSMKLEINSTKKLDTKDCEMLTIDILTSSIKKINDSKLTAIRRL